MSRNSPSGPFVPIKNPYPGSSDLDADETQYFRVGSTQNLNVNEIDGQIYIRQASKLLQLTAVMLSAGTDPVTHTFNVRVNGVNVPGMTLTLVDNVALVPVTVGPSGSGELGVGDLVSLQLISGLDLGVLGTVRTFLDIGER